MMKQLSFLSSIFLILAGCSSKEEPVYPVFMQPSSIQSVDANANNQTFEYDEYGRIVSWNCTSNSTNDPSSYSAHYSYPDENTIKVTAEEILPTEHRFLEESIQLNNGRASKSEGTYMATIHTEDWSKQLQKTYRLAFDYLPSNHLNVVEHSEVYGMGDDIKDNAWDDAWTWENYLIWENGNLKEFQDYQGNSTPYQTTKFEYSVDAVSYLMVIPMVIIKFAHHIPLCMQGVFGSNSVNLAKSASSFDHKGNLFLSRQYSYEVEGTHISKYTEVYNFLGSVFSDQVTYTVNWTVFTDNLIESPRHDVVTESFHHCMKN